MDKQIPRKYITHPIDIHQTYIGCLLCAMSSVLSLGGITLLGHKHRLWNQTVGVQILALPIISCRTGDKLTNQSYLSFSFL